MAQNAVAGVVGREQVERNGASILRRVMEWPLGTVSIVARATRGTATRNRTVGPILRWNHLLASPSVVPPPVTGRVGRGVVAMGGQVEVP